MALIKAEYFLIQTIPGWDLYIIYLDNTSIVGIVYAQYTYGICMFCLT